MSQGSFRRFPGLRGLLNIRRIVLDVPGGKGKEPPWPLKSLLRKTGDDVGAEASVAQSEEHRQAG
jgi:hypothetical protein